MTEERLGEDWELMLQFSLIFLLEVVGARVEDALAGKASKSGPSTFIEVTCVLDSNSILKC